MKEIPTSYHKNIITAHTTLQHSNNQSINLTTLKLANSFRDGRGV